MMGGGAFDLLNPGQNRPESAKQAEIRLASLLKILDNRLPGGPSGDGGLAKSGQAHAMVVAVAISGGYG
jgi:hypothetical protein